MTKQLINKKIEKIFNGEPFKNEVAKEIKKGLKLWLKTFEKSKLKTKQDLKIYRELKTLINE